MIKHIWSEIKKDYKEWANKFFCIHEYTVVAQDDCASVERCSKCNKTVIYGGYR